MSSKKSSGKKSSSKKSASKSTSKKSSGKKSGSKKGTSSLSAAVAAGDASAALLSVSATATAQDAKESAILSCLSSCFSNNGFGQLSPSAMIVWQIIPDNIVIILGNCVRDCINGRGFDSPGWAIPFRDLKRANQVSVVRDLVTAMAAMVRP